MSNEHSQEQSVSRRQILSAGLSGCVSCLLLTGCGGTGGQTAASNAPPLALGPVDAGPVAAYNRDGIHSGFADKGFFIAREGSRLFALSSVCTHQQVILDAGEGDIGCPRHGSIFNLDGTLAKGPARRSLPRHAVRVDERGHVIVDTSVQFDSSQKDAVGAFITV